MRLDKFISNQKSISRSEIKLLLKKGAVSVNGKTVSSPDLKILPEKDEIRLLGERVLYKEHLYLMLNKPAGVVSSTREGRSETVLDLVPTELFREGLFPAGRLDKDTVGFVLLTDDGDLAHRLLAPKSHVPKTYYCRLEKPYSSLYESSFKNGVILEDGTPCLPAEISKGEEADSAYVVLHEGMFHQVKRMFEAMGNKVVFLKRIKIGGLWLDSSLAEGKCRELTPDEILKLQDRI